MARSPGHRIGVYHIPGLLGLGGWGEVYRAPDDRLRRDVEVNVMPPPRTADPDRLEPFQWEAQALAALNRPPVGQVGLEPHGDNRPSPGNGWTARH